MLMLSTCFLCFNTSLQDLSTAGLSEGEKVAADLLDQALKDRDLQELEASAMVNIMAGGDSDKVLASVALRNGESTEQITAQAWAIDDEAEQGGLDESEDADD